MSDHADEVCDATGDHTKNQSPAPEIVETCHKNSSAYKINL